MCVSCDDVWVALRQVPPSAMREVAIQVPKVSSSSESTHACVIVRVSCACVRACMCVCVCVCACRCYGQTLEGRRGSSNS